MQNLQTSGDSTLLFSKRFYPIFWVQFLAAFNDNLYKNAMVMLIAFQFSQTGEQTGLYITLAAGLFILPFFLFSSFAGQLADHFPKSILIQKIQLAEIFIMATGAVGFLTMQLEWLFLALFLMGTQSAFFGPIKYSVLPEVLDQSQLLRGNAWFSGSTFIAILLGTIIGGSLVMTENGVEIISVTVLSMSILGYLFSLQVPETKQASPEAVIDKNILRSTWKIVQLGRSHKAAFFAVLAISWFWFIGAVLLSQIPTFVKYTLQANEEVVVAFLTLFSIGIAV
ncbi:MAG TPA: MFS transporter, partial [Thiomicrospira sp.]|nr:MFS transporter [Thiomicrospira sp.]